MSSVAIPEPAFPSTFMDRRTGTSSLQKRRGDAEAVASGQPSECNAKTLSRQVDCPVWGTNNGRKPTACSQRALEGMRSSENGVWDKFAPQCYVQKWRKTTIPLVRASQADDDGDFRLVWAGFSHLTSRWRLMESNAIYSFFHYKAIALQSADVMAIRSRKCRCNACSRRPSLRIATGMSYDAFLDTLGALCHPYYIDS